MITMNSDKFRGAVRLSMAESFVLNLSKAHQQSTSDGSIPDATLATIEAGLKTLFAVAKSRLAAIGIVVSQALPNLFVGTVMSRTGSRETVLVLPVDCQLGQFFIEVITASE